MWRSCRTPAERCWSGRTGLPAKQLSGVNPDRGFESLPLRHFLRQSMKAYNPATEELIRDYPEPDGREVEERLATAERTFAAWRKVPFAERARLMHAAADRLREHRADYGQLMTEEMGKTITAAEAEVDKCAWVCDYYAENAEELLATQSVATDASRSCVRYDPLGPVLAIMPWNFPFWQVFRFAAPALMAGN